jgi:hypothetical protein
MPARGSPIRPNLTAPRRRPAGARTVRAAAPARPIQAPGKVIGRAAGWLVGRLK